MKILLIISLLLITAAVHAQQYSIDWYKTSGGGGTSTNGQYSVTGTIGQPDAGGAMSGGSYSLTGGFLESHFRGANGGVAQSGHHS